MRRRGGLRALVAGAVLVCLLAGASAWRLGSSRLAAAGSGPVAETAFMRFRASEHSGRGVPPGIAWVRLEDLPPVAICAVVKAEDRGFFRHGGFEWGQVRKAAAQVREANGMGGSTISQQVARNLFLTPERSFRRKALEALITLGLERELPKARILEVYLNVIEWGDGVWGIDAAARHYFGKPARELDAAESAFLAGLIAAPLRPLEGANLARAYRVQRRVLGQLRASGLLGDEEWEAAVARTRLRRNALRLGRSLREAHLAADSVQAPPGTRPGEGVREVRSVLAEECGLERELAAGGAR